MSLQAQIPEPVRGACDPRSMLLRHVRGRALARLEEREGERLDTLRAGGWREYAQQVRANVARAYGDIPFASAGGPLKARPASTIETHHCRIENVLFESFPGWEVNASVFVPPGEGPFPCVVIPVGHSGKQFANYQIPAQAFASLGFIAVLFDPPGQASEKQTGNDHFRDGVRTYLTGANANRYFTIDALRCIDYLETRADADLSRGVGMTGVSGGGRTTTLAALYDQRVACQGPSCCLTRMAHHPIGDAYSICPEVLWPDRIADGVDEIDLVLAALPTTCVYMAGRDDEVGHIEWTRQVGEVLREGARLAGFEGRCEFFEDDAPHAYTLAQVTHFAAWMKRWMLDEAAPEVAELDPADFEELDHMLLECRPAPVENMFTINRALARELRLERPRLETPAAASQAVAGLVADRGAAAVLAGDSAPFPLWTQDYREALFRANGLELPATILTPRPGFDGGGKWLVFLDDNGRRQALESNGLAARLSLFTEREPKLPHPNVLAADLPGWGDSQPALAPYALAGWGSMDRTLAYMSASLGDPVLAIQVRCAAALVRYLLYKRQVQASDIVFVGRGLGGAAALMAGALTPGLGGIVSLEGLASFQCLAEEEDYSWPSCAFLPKVLRHFDLPDLARAPLARTILILNPTDAARAELGAAAADNWYSDSPRHLQVAHKRPPGEVVDLILGLLAAPTQ